MINAKLKSMLIIASISALVFTGCGSRAQNSTNYPNDTKPQYMVDNKDDTSNSISEKKDQTGKTAQTSIKTLYSKTLKQLVTAKTITQTQANKVLSALTQNMSQGQMGTSYQGKTGTSYQGQMGTSNQGQMGTPNQGQMGTSNQIQSGTPNQYQTEKSNGTSLNNMRLNSLVKSKVITQAQANTINQKIKAAMKNMQTR